MNRQFATGLAAVTMTFAAGAAHAAACSVSDVTVTGIRTAGGATVSSSTFVAAECAGAYTGNAIPHSGTQGGENLGYYGDGLFNGAAAGGNGNASFPDGIFHSQYASVEQDLNHDGKKDPGWIYLGTWTPGIGFLTATIGSAANIVLSSWFTVTGTGSRGTWSFTPDADVVSRVAPILGGSLFDQFALSFKSGNAFAAYDFTAQQLDLPLVSSTIYNFSGSWDMSRTLLNGGGRAAALSHVDLYVRDPALPANIPEPGALALLGAALSGMLLRRRRSADR